MIARPDRAIIPPLRRAKGPTYSRRKLKALARKSEGFSLRTIAKHTTFDNVRRSRLQAQPNPLFLDWQRHSRTTAGCQQRGHRHR